MAKEGTIINESQLSEFMSMSGKGKNFPEGTAIRYYPKKIIIGNPGGQPVYRDNDGSVEITSKIKNLNNGISVVDGKLVKQQKKRVGGRPTPTGDKVTEFTKDKKGKLKQKTSKVDPSLKDKGNIGSKFGLGTQTMKSDLELLREKRKKQGRSIEKAEKEKKEKTEKFRKKEEEALKKKKFSRGSVMIDYRKRKGGLFS
tara:strand:- start:515 stop:1111 length:597 start_codon:yes stop_codon:yes gene_type:complete